MKPMDLSSLDPLTRDVVESAIEWYTAVTEEKETEAEYNLVSACERYTGDVPTDDQGNDARVFTNDSGVPRKAGGVPRKAGNADEVV